MKRQLSRLGAVPGALLALVALVTTGVVNPTAASAHPVPAWTSSPGTVLQTNLVSDLPGVAATTDPNLVNAWGISESSGSPFWISDNNAGLTTLYNVLTSTSVTINPLVVNIPTPVSPTGGTPTGTVFNTAPSTANAFQVTGPNKAGLTTTASAVFLFDTEDGTIVGWNPGIDPTGQFAGLPGGNSNHAVIALDNSGNNFTNPDPNQQTGAVYKGLAIATSTTPILTGDANSTALLYASNFRAGTIEVYDAKFDQSHAVAAGALSRTEAARGYAPFNVQVLNGKVYVTYAMQDAAKHDDVAGPHHGFVDVFNLDGTPGLSGGRVRLVSRGALDSPWGLAIAPTGFAGLNDRHNNPVLLVGNFGNGLINAFDSVTGALAGPAQRPRR